MMKKLILDYSTWRCGCDSDNHLGEGDTALRNKEGFMCCLGQFSLQLDSGLKENDLLEAGEPYETSKEIPCLTTVSDDENDDSPVFSNTALSDEAISINDNEETTPEEKIEKLKRLFKGYEYEIEVINKPTTV